jgi:hypothetical protein
MVNKNKPLALSSHLRFECKKYTFETKEEHLKIVKPAAALFRLYIFTFMLPKGMC